ncbi:MAG: sulfurtransferase TusA family protein [Kiloniellales bacterium]
MSDTDVSDTAPKSDRTLDAKGLKCPLPVLRARKAIKEVPAGGILEVLATDPSAPEDFVSFCETTGHELLENRQDGDVYVLRIRKTG